MSWKVSMQSMSKSLQTSGIWRLALRLLGLEASVVTMQRRPRSASAYAIRNGSRSASILNTLASSRYSNTVSPFPST